MGRLGVKMLLPHGELFTLDSVTNAISFLRVVFVGRRERTNIKIVALARHQLSLVPRKGLKPVGR